MGRSPTRDRPQPETVRVASVKQRTPTTPAAPPPPLLSQGGEQNPVTPQPRGSAAESQENLDTLPATATLQQRRAAFALRRIQIFANRWEGDPDKQQQFNKEFNSYASAMPFMIHANGLGQTAAFYRRKGTDHTYYQIYQLLGNWLSQPGQPFAGKDDLLMGIIQSDMAAYLAAQAEAMMFLDWVKKLASAFLSHDEEGSK